VPAGARRRMAALQAALQPLGPENLLSLLKLYDFYADHPRRFEKLAAALSVPGELELAASTVELVCVKLGAALPRLFSPSTAAAPRLFVFPTCHDGSPLESCLYCNKVLEWGRVYQPFTVHGAGSASASREGATTVQKCNKRARQRSKQTSLPVAVAKHERQAAQRRRIR